MKLSLTLALLPLALASLNPRTSNNKLEELPTKNIADLSDTLFTSAGSEEAKSPAKGKQFGNEFSTQAKLCPKGYPFLCDGFCCQYNRCCKRQCCSPKATFCGADGYCYRYNK